MRAACAKHAEGEVVKPLTDDVKTVHAVVSAGRVQVVRLPAWMQPAADGLDLAVGQATPGFE